MASQTDAAAQHQAMVNHAGRDCADGWYRVVARVHNGGDKTMIGCDTCLNLTAAIIAGEEREHLTPCWDCEGWRNYVNKYCSTCKYRNMNGEDDDPPCHDCGSDYCKYEEGEPL